MTDYLKNILMHNLKNTVLLNVSSRKKGKHLKTVLNNDCPILTACLNKLLFPVFPKENNILELVKPT